jgi:uncharacterized protein YqeY
MNLLNQLNADLLEATKTGDALVRDTLRIVKTSIKNAEIAKGITLNDEQIVDVIAKEVKQRQEAAAAFTNGNRPELAEKEQQETAVLKKYLPEQISEEELSAMIDEAIVETGASAMNEMGKVMGALIPKIKGRADAGLVSQIVRQKLG